MSDEAKPITVMVVDDHDIVRRGLCDLFESDGDIVVTGQAGSIADGLRVAERTNPDIAVLDVRLPDGTGIELCREIRDNMPDIRCVMLTSFADDEALVEAAEAGACAYLLKEVNSTDIVAAIRSVAGGAQLLDAAEVRMAESRISRSDLALPDTLSPQEHRIFELIGDGRSNRQIADELFLAEKTVKNYVSNMLAKLGMSRRTEVAALAARIREHERRRFQ